MQKLNMIQAFAELPEGTEALFAHPEGQAEQARLIKMKINAPQATNLYITDQGDPDEDGVIHDGDVRFLAHVAPGFEQLEFYYKGSFTLACVGGNVWLDTYDNTSFSVEASDFTSYARLWEREEEDPRILEIQRIARHNREELQRQMAEDRAAFAAQMRAVEERVAANVTPAQTPASGGTPSPEPKVPASAPAVDPATATPAPGGTGGEPDAEA
jgi:hypothetical protein